MVLNYVGIAITAYNLKRIGREILKQEKEKLKKRKLRRVGLNFEKTKKKGERASSGHFRAQIHAF